jgi:hypothetical protein
MRGLALILAVLAGVGGVCGQQGRVDGEWNWRMESQMGLVTARVVLRTEGTKLMGTFHFSETRRLEIEDGTIVGDDLRFTVRRDRREGGTMVYQMVGRMMGNEIRGTARAGLGEPPAVAEWVMQRVLPAPQKRGPVSAGK